MKKLIDEAIRFGMVGVINTVVGYVLIMVFYNVWNWNYWVASGTSYIIGSIFSYFANRKLTFKTQERGWKPAVRFGVNIAVCYFIAYGVAKPLVAGLLQGYTKAVVENIAIIVGMGLFIILNFIGQKFMVFKKRDSDNTGDILAGDDK